MRHIGPVARAIRALPQPERSNALRSMLLRHFGNIPGLVCSRSALEERAACKLLGKRKQTPATAALAFTAACALGFVPIRPATAATLRLDANLASIHTERWARDSLNQRNPGIGLEYQASRTWAIAAGIYSNSYRKPTAYALAEFTPLHIGAMNHWHVDAGVVAGLASGYTRFEIPCAPLVGATLIRAVAPDGVALNVLGVPNSGPYNSGFIGFQVSVPLSRGGE